MLHRNGVADAEGFEPPVLGLTTQRLCHLSFTSKWWSVEDSNLRSPVCKTGAFNRLANAPLGHPGVQLYSPACGAGTRNRTAFSSLEGWPSSLNALPARWVLTQKKPPAGAEGFQTIVAVRSIPLGVRIGLANAGEEE